MYECIFASHDSQRRRGRYWLRLTETPQGAVAIVSEVKGNSGPSVTEAVAQIALTLIERFSLDPTTLTLIEHYPPDSLELTDGEATYDLVKLVWLGDRYASPQWRPLTPKDVAQLLDEPRPLARHFWKQTATGWYACVVGVRGAVVGQVDVDEWQAVVNQTLQQATIRRFATVEEAQGWALDQLANLAAEYDSFPIQLRG